MRDNGIKALMKISVIIPVYNVEKYLNRCVDSVLNQTYQNLEVVLVDDGSTDNSSAICDEYAKSDGRVIVIHKKNGGQSSARNAALDHPLSGDYITFVDSDDWINKDYYRHCIHIQEQYMADVVQVDYSFATGTRISKSCPPKEVIGLYAGKEILQYYMISTTATGSYSVCRCLFKSSLIGRDRFRDGQINEDIDWKYKVLSKAKRMAVSNQVMYYYYQSGNSTTSGGLKQRDFQLREAAELLAKMTSKETYGSIAFLGKVKQARTAFSLLSKIAYFGVAEPTIEKKETVNKLIKEHRGNLTTLLKAPLPLSRKVLAMMFAISFPFTEACIHLAKQLEKK